MESQPEEKFENVLPPLEFNLAVENDKLNIYLMAMIELQEAFTEMAQEQGYDLNYSLNSLDELERYCLEQHVTFDDPSDAALAQRSNCWNYLGEVVRKNYGGRWEFSANEDNSANWGMYVITGHCSVEGVEFEPLGILTGFLLRPKPGALRGAVLADVDSEWGNDLFKDLEDDE